ncbi:MAG: hypothetical protein GEV12_20370 [Micromonosporaceae bacterium]|nr:hypothetical protein [Micromonosporaceae bacterium]
MPDEDADYARRGARLTPVLFWAGLGLAPFAGLLLLLGNGGLRAGALLSVLALALIGLSFALRPDPTQVRLQLEETLLEELDRLRAEVREDIANASRATHQTVGERMGALQQVVESLRAERARFAAGPPSAVPAPVGPRPAASYPVASQPVAAHPVGPPVGSHPVGSHPVGPPVGSHPVAAPVGSHPLGAPHSVPPPMAAPRSAPPQPVDPTGRPPGPPVSAPAAGTRRRAGRRSARDQDQDRDQDPAQAHRAPPSGRAAAQPATGGVYRHTETVQVTTRSTYVDEHSPNGDGGRRYDGGYGSRDWSGSAPRSRPAEPYEESWTDQKLRERYGRRPRPYDRADDASGEQPWTGESAPWHPVSAEPAGSPGPAGPPERRHRRPWDDEPAGEVRIGQRRAAARHSDEHGTELRLEERWASVRRDDNSHGRGDHRGADYQSADHRGTDYGHSDNDRGPEPDYSRPALPASSSEPSWNDSWEEPVRESRGHRYRPDFELSDERWR